MPQHTPGPWSISQGTECDCPGSNYHETDCETARVLYITADPSGSDLGPLHLATVYETAIPADQANANALLIAAAPEILEALKAILDRPDADARMIAAAAVARAEGR